MRHKIDYQRQKLWIQLVGWDEVSSAKCTKVCSTVLKSPEFICELGLACDTLHSSHSTISFRNARSKWSRHTRRDIQWCLWSKTALETRANLKSINPGQFLQTLLCTPEKHLSFAKAIGEVWKTRISFQFGNIKWAGFIWLFFVNSSLKNKWLSLTHLWQQEQLLLIQASKTVKSLLNMFIYISYKIQIVLWYRLHSFLYLACLFIYFLYIYMDPDKLEASAKNLKFRLCSKTKIKEAVQEAGMCVCMCVGERQWMKRTRLREAGRGTIKPVLMWDFWKEQRRTEAL